MREFLRFAAVFGDTPTPFYKNPFIIAAAALVVALIILVVALFLFRNSGKKKAGNANLAGQSDWQRQQGQAGAQGAWGQQPAGWGANAPQQQPGSWGNPTSQPQQGAWGAPAQPGAVGGAGWGTPAAPQPQQGGWGTPAQQQAPGWGNSADAQQQPAGWGSPASAQQQQPAGWGAQQQQPSGWGNASGQSAQQAWDQTTPPVAPASDPWGQPQAAPSWGSPGNQQQAPNAFGASGSGQSWGQAAQPVDQWGQPIQQQGQQSAWPGSVSQPSSTPPGGNAPVPSWQQQGQGIGQNQPGFGAMENPDGDRTLLRPSGAPAAGPQGRLGIVRIEEGKEPGRVYEVRKESLSIGRSRESDIFLEDLAVSRLHASIISMGNGNYALRDEGSANGTKVNGQTVNKYQPYPLQEGDKIQLGQTVLVFARR